jgi:hypothetical protein
VVVETGKYSVAVTRRENITYFDVAELRVGFTVDAYG